MLQRWIRDIYNMLYGELAIVLDIEKTDVEDYIATFIHEHEYMEELEYEACSD